MRLVEPRADNPRLASGFCLVEAEYQYPPRLLRLCSNQGYVTNLPACVVIVVIEASFVVVPLRLGYVEGERRGIARCRKERSLK